MPNLPSVEQFWLTKIGPAKLLFTLIEIFIATAFIICSVVLQVMAVNISAYSLISV